MINFLHYYNINMQKMQKINKLLHFMFIVSTFKLRFVFVGT